MFLAVLELPAVWGLAPWHTLSWTTRTDERQWPVLYLVVVGFLWGLSLHMASGVNLFYAWALGVLLATGSHLLTGWPKW